MPLIISVEFKNQKKKKVVWYMYSRPWPLDISRQKSDWHFLANLRVCDSPFYPAMAQSQCLMATSRNSVLSLRVIVGCLCKFICTCIYIQIDYIQKKVYIEIFIDTCKSVPYFLLCQGIKRKRIHCRKLEKYTWSKEN